MKKQERDTRSRSGISRRNAFNTRDASEDIKRILALLVAGTALVILLSSCSSTPVNLVVKVERPAEVDMQKHRKIAFGYVDRKRVPKLVRIRNENLIDACTSRLLESGLFDILDRRNVRILIGEDDVDTANYSPEGRLLAMGKEHGASAMIFMRIKEYGCPDLPEIEEESNQVQWQQPPLYTGGHCGVTVRVEISDCNTWRYLYAHDITRTMMVYSPAPGSSLSTEYKEQVCRALMDAVAEDFLRIILPHKEEIPVTLLTDRNIPDLEKGTHAALESGWNDALAIFRSAADRHPNSGEAWYDLGVAFGFGKQYGESYAALRKAADLGQSAQADRMRAVFESLEKDQGKASRNPSTPE